MFHRNFSYLEQLTLRPGNEFAFLVGHPRDMAQVRHFNPDGTQINTTIRERM